MRNRMKKMMTLITAGALAVTAAASLAGCGGNFKPLSSIPSGAVSSNGGFVVGVADYIYFINGVESYTSDNTYGEPVKGALMRAKKSELASGGGEIVVPSLMTAGDYDAGIYIYGDRVYYATPNNIENTAGQVEQNYLDFKSAKLDGSSVVSYFNVSDNAASYRFVQVDGTVYVLYTESETLHSYNTAKKTDTVLAKDVSDVIFSDNKEDPYAYYTMGVTMDADIESGSHDRDYNQLFRVRADATECPYAEIRDYAWNKDYLDENDGEAPYLNFGMLLLDGIGAIYQDEPTIFSHDVAGSTPLSAAGYTYTVQSVTDDGIYFTRADLATTGSVGEAGWLYFLSMDKLASGNSVTRNADDTLDVVAQPTETEQASDEAIFYIEDGKHHYLFTEDSNIYRADVDETGKASVLRIAQGIGTATLVCIDSSDSTYRYLYYTVSGSSGNNIYRVVYNGTEEDYKTLGYDSTKPYRATQVLNIQHAKSWYDFEMIDGLLFFADSETIGNAAYNYTAYVDLKNASGAMMNNSELSDYNDKLDETLGDEGYLAKLSDDDRTALSTAVKYYFYTGKTELFYENIEEAKTESGKTDYELYHKDDIADFDAYTKAGHTLRSDFIHAIGKMSEADEENLNSYWKTTLEHYTAPESTEETEGGLPAWAGALIGIAVGIVVIGIAVGVYLVIRSKKSEEAETEEKMFVDTTDDKSVDVYSDEPTPAEETPEETSEEAEEAQEESESEEAAGEEESGEANEEVSEEAPEVAEEQAPEAEQSAESADAPQDGQKPEGEPEA